MKLKALFSLMLGAMALTASAQMGGYQDGVDNYNAGRLDVYPHKADTENNVPFFWNSLVRE